jgi:Glyoxalase-like domain
MADPIRIRQICLVAERLEPTLDLLTQVLGIKVCGGKADLTAYGVPNRVVPPYQKAFFEGLGLASAIMPIGDCFLEVVAPLRPDTAAARYLDRRGAGGYMVITEVGDTAAFGARVAAQGVRLAGVVDYPTYHELQLDPRDVGASMLTFAMQREGKPFDGGWFPAGPQWQDRSAAEYTGIVSAMIAAPDPDAVAGRWAAVIGRPVEVDEAARRIRLDGSQVEFSGAEQARLSAFTVKGQGWAAAQDRARAVGLPISADGAIAIAGISINCEN